MMQKTLHSLPSSSPNLPIGVLAVAASEVNPLQVVEGHHQLRPVHGIPRGQDPVPGNKVDLISAFNRWKANAKDIDMKGNYLKI